MNPFSHHHIGSALLMSLVLVAVFGTACDELFVAGVKTLFEEIRQRDFKGMVRKSDDQQRITSVVGKGTKVYRGTPREMATQFLEENRELFGLPKGLGDLRLLNEKARSYSAHVEFQQIWKGLPVENGRIQISFDKQGHVVHVVNSYTPSANALDQTSVSKEQARETAINEFLRTTPENPSKQQQQQENRSGKIVSRDQLRLKEEPKVDDVYFAWKERLHRAYRISIKAVRPFGIKQFVIDANSGEILYTKNFISSWTDGQGTVFKPNPVNSENNPQLFRRGDRNDRDDAVRINNPNPYYTVPLLGLEASAAPFTLRGPFVVLEDIEAPSNTPPSLSDANAFNFNRSADEFEEVMIYFHIDSMQRYIQEELRFNDVMNRRLSVDAHGLDGEDNSRYVSTPETLGEGYIAFGDGGVDDAEDADVIAHEYGHAIQDNQAPGKFSGTGIPRAMGEGFGDYWAASFHARQTLDNKHDVGCLMEWDAVPDECRRRADDGPLVSSFNPSFIEWENGRIWSRTLFQIFIEFGRNFADRLILQSHFEISDSPTSFKDGADAIIAADEELFDGSNKTKLCKIFVNRGIYDRDCSS